MGRSSPEASALTQGLAVCCLHLSTRHRKACLWFCVCTRQGQLRERCTVMALLEQLCTHLGLSLLRYSRGGEKKHAQPPSRCLGRASRPQLCFLC